MNEIFVIDLETTGLRGYPQDKVVEIGIASLNVDTGKITERLSRIVHQPLAEADRNSWIFQNTDLKYEDVYSEDDETGELASYLRKNYEDYLFTSYNVDFDFCRFLWSNEWNFNPWLATDIMEECAKTVPDRNHAGAGKYPSAQASYNFLCPDNPMGLEKERHRAVSDAVFECHILWNLMRVSKTANELYREELRDWNNEGGWMYD